MLGKVDCQVCVLQWLRRPRQHMAPSCVPAAVGFIAQFYHTPCWLQAGNATQVLLIYTSNTLLLYSLPADAPLKVI